MTQKKYVLFTREYLVEGTENIPISKNGIRMVYCFQQSPALHAI